MISREEEDRLLTADPVRNQRLLALEKAVVELRKEASKDGSGKITAQQINSEIEAYRREKQHKKVKQPAL